MTQLPILCDGSRSLLLVVDIQPALTAAMAEEASESMIEHTSILLQAATALDIPVLVTEQYPNGLGRTEPLLLERLPLGTPRFEKTGFSCCAAAGFGAALGEAGREQIVIVGQETHVCVLQTALDLIRGDHAVFVVEDAVCSRRTSHKLFALERMRSSGAVITNHESVLFEWLRDATHPQFKPLSKLLR